MTMRNMVRAAGALALACSLNVEAFAVTWEIDASHSVVGFSVRHLMISNVKGIFKDVEGAIEFDGKDASKASVSATIQMTSVDTGVESRDKHLMNADFFDVEKFPTMTFKSTKVEPAGDNKAKITGDLTLHGVTKSVTLDAELNGVMASKKGDKAGFTATTSVLRGDFGLKYNKVLEAGGVAISDEVKITIEIEAVEKKK